MKERDFKSEQDKEGRGSLSVCLVSVQGQLEGTSWAPFLVLSPRQGSPWPVERCKAYEMSPEERSRLEQPWVGRISHTKLETVCALQGRECWKELKKDLKIIIIIIIRVCSRVEAISK